MGKGGLKAVNIHFPCFTNHRVRIKESDCELRLCPHERQLFKPCRRNLKGHRDFHHAGADDISDEDMQRLIDLAANAETADETSAWLPLGFVSSEEGVSSQRKILIKPFF